MCNEWCNGRADQWNGCAMNGVMAKHISVEWMCNEWCNGRVDQWNGCAMNGVMAEQISGMDVQ